MIFTESAFYYGPTITEANNAISFSEGAGPEILTTIPVKKYTLTTFANALLLALNDAGALTYSYTMDRKTRVITISATGNFSLKVSTSSVENTLFDDLGFTGSDRTGAATYTGNAAIGTSYKPQFRLQSFVDFEDNQRAVDSSLLVTASGEVELIRFGLYKIMECDIDFITDIDQGAENYIRTNLSGVDDARSFLEYCVTKGPMEFLPDYTQPNTFTNCILERTPESSTGVDFKLKERFSEGLPGYYRTGLLAFRKVSL